MRITKKFMSSWGNHKLLRNKRDSFISRPNKLKKGGGNIPEAKKLPTRTLQLAMVGLFIVAVLIMAAMAPWGEGLGPSYSPGRIGLTYVVVIVGYLLPGLIAIYLFSKKPEWVAPPGRYVAGTTYKLYSTYALTGAAILGAVYAVSGLPTGVNIDLPALIAGFGATYFGPHVMLPAFFLGFFVRWAIGGAAWLPVPLLGPAVALLDSTIWVIGAYIFWSLTRTPRYEKATGGTRAAYFLLALISMIVVWNFGFIVWYAFVGNPLPAFIAYATFAYSTWIPTGVVFIILGTIIGHSTYTARAAPPKKRA
jgi:hypothetical protein